MKNKNLFNGRFVFDAPSGPKETASTSSGVERSKESTETTNPKTAENKKMKEHLTKTTEHIVRQTKRENLIDSIKNNNHTPDAAKTTVENMKIINQEIKDLLIKKTKTDNDYSKKEILAIITEKEGIFKKHFRKIKEEFYKDSRKGYELKENNTVWGLSKKLLTRSGLEKPNNKQIKNLAVGICINNGINVDEWGLTDGKLKDTNLDIGQKIAIPKNNLNIALNELASSKKPTKATEDATTIGKSMPVEGPSPKREI